MVSCGFFGRVRKLWQGSRQALLLRSHYVPLGRWHLKSLVITTCLLLVMFYYMHTMSFQSGSTTKKRNLVVRAGKPYERPYSRRKHSKIVKDEKSVPPIKYRGNESSTTKKRDLVVRAGKPYKSPYSRRKHAKIVKDEKSVPPIKHRGNESLAQSVKKPGTKLNKTKPAAQQAARTNETKVAPSNALLQRAEKYNSGPKSKPHQNVPSFSQVSTGKGQILDTFKDIHKIENKKYFPRNSGGLVKNVTNDRILGQKINKAVAFSNQLSGHQQKDKSLKVPNAAIYDNTNHLTQKGKNVVPGGIMLKSLLKPVDKVNRSTDEGHTAQSA